MRLLDLHSQRQRLERYRERSLVRTVHHNDIGIKTAGGTSVCLDIVEYLLGRSESLALRTEGAGIGLLEVTDFEAGIAGRIEFPYLQLFLGRVLAVDGQGYALYYGLRLVGICLLYTSPSPRD